MKARRCSETDLCPLSHSRLMSLQAKDWCVPLALLHSISITQGQKQKLRLPVRRRGSTISFTPDNTVRRPTGVLHPLSAARYAFSRSVNSFRSWSTSGWRSSSASITPTGVLSSPPAPVPMTVDDYGPMLFQDISYLAYKANQHAFNSTQQLRLREILHAEEPDDFFTERETLEIEARLFCGSESEAMAPEKNLCSRIKSYDIEDNSGAPVMLYAGLRQCGGVTQKNRGRVAHDYWSRKDEEIMQSNREALRAAYLSERIAAKKQPETALVEEQQVEEQQETIEESAKETTQT